MFGLLLIVPVPAVFGFECKPDPIHIGLLKLNQALFLAGTLRPGREEVVNTVAFAA